MTAEEQVEALAAKIRPILAGQPPGIVGAALADLVAILLAGHVIRGDAPGTAALREDLLQLHITAVRTLIPVNAKMIGTDE